MLFFQPRWWGFTGGMFPAVARPWRLGGPEIQENPGGVLPNHPFFFLGFNRIFMDFYSKPYHFYIMLVGFSMK